MKTPLVTLLIGTILGSVLTYWVHPFAKVATYVEVQKPEIQIRADDYKRCNKDDVRINSKGKVETRWECGVNKVFYTTSEVRVSYKERN